jgi:hypothetical protein
VEEVALVDGLESAGEARLAELRKDGLELRLLGLAERPEDLS